MLRLSNKLTIERSQYPIRVVQFGEGNFLRVFADWMIHMMNKKIGFGAGVAVVQPIEDGMVDQLFTQDGLFTTFIKGIQGDKLVNDSYLIDGIQLSINPYKQFDKYLKLVELSELKVIISNTTEAGISYSSDSHLDTPLLVFRLS